MNMSTHTVAIRITIVCATLPAVLALAGCGTSTSTARGVPAPIMNSALVTQAHNQADITFVEDMIPHNLQAVAMSKLVPDHGGDAQVKSSAALIQAGQQTAIDQMNGFMQAWNSSSPPPGGPPATSLNPAGTGGTAPRPMPAMMSPETMLELSRATGPTFDKMFLRMMSTHHVAAIVMSKTEVSDGLNPGAKALAQRIIDTEQSEIIEMRAMGRRLDHTGGW